MDNKLLNRLTKQDIAEIHQALDSEASYVMDGDKCIRQNTNEYYSSVLKKLKANNPNYKPFCKDRYKTLVEIAEKVTEQKYEDNRHFGNVLIKCLVSNRLREEGYTFGEIGKAMNKDHSTIVFYVGKMDDMLSLPLMYSKEMRTRSLFNDEIEKHDEQE